MLFSFQSSAQKSVDWTAGVSTSYNPQAEAYTLILFPIYYIFPLPSYLETNAKLGARIELDKGYLSVYGEYQHRSNLRWVDLSAFIFRSHLLGFGVDYSFKKDKRFSPIIGMSLKTEVYSNYKNEYYKDNFPSGEFNGTNNISLSKKVRFYHSTPFYASIWIGYDIALGKRFYLNLLLANDLRVVRTKELNVIQADLENQSLTNALRQKSYDSMIHDVLMFRLGLTYNFSFKKE